MTFSLLAKAGAGLLAATITLSGGAAVVTAAHSSSKSDNQAHCQAYQQDLAQHLNISVQQFQQAKVSTLNQIIDQQLAAGKLTATEAQKAHDRVNNQGGTCTAVKPAKTAKHQAGEKVRKTELAAVAQKLGISKKDLAQQLHGGATLAQIAQAHNVSRDDLKLTLRTTLQADLTTAVQGGKITQAQADKALQHFNQEVDKVIDKVWPAKKR